MGQYGSAFDHFPGCKLVISTGITWWKLMSSPYYQFMPTPTTPIGINDSNQIYCWGQQACIPDICQFWYTPVKRAPKSAWIRDIVAKIGQNFAFSVAVVTNISYASTFHLTVGISYYQCNLFRLFRDWILYFFLHQNNPNSNRGYDLYFKLSWITSIPTVKNKIQ